MKGRNKGKGIMIMPNDIETVIRAKHWLIARDREFKELHIPIDADTTQTIIISEFSLADRLLYRLSFRDKKTESVNVYC